MGARTNIVPQRISRGNKTGATSGRLVQYLMDCVWMKAVKVGGGGGRWRYEVEIEGGVGLEMVVGGGVEMKVEGREGGDARWKCELDLRRGRGGGDGGSKWKEDVEVGGARGRAEVGGCRRGRGGMWR